MKLIDKLKNVFFEEVEEEDVDEIPKSYAKKVEVPKKKTSFFKQDDEEEKEEKVSKKTLDNFLEEDEISYQEEKTSEPIVSEEHEIYKSIPMMFDDDDFLEDTKSVQEEEKEEEIKGSEISSYKRENNEYIDKELYQGKKDTAIKESFAPNYSYSKTVYKKEEVKGFRPSPIISPIYGILDKNYHKEEIVTKRETRVTSSYGKPDLDSVRNKAFASYDEEKEMVTKPKKNDNKKSAFDDDNKVYDVNNDKPKVHRVTIADADEYYNDLGLAYNVDYSDASRTTTRSAKYNVKEKKKDKKDVDDNLFDLIDSMYSKED